MGRNTPVGAAKMSLLLALAALAGVACALDTASVNKMLQQAATLQDPYDLVDMAAALGEGGYPQHAAPLLRRALQLPGMEPMQQHQVRYNLAFTLQQLGDLRAALPLFESVGAAAGISDAWVKAAQCAKELGMPAAAVGHLQNALKAAAGSDPRIYQYLGDVLNNLKRFSEAEAAYKEGLSLLRKLTRGRLDEQSRALAVSFYHHLGDTLLNVKQPAAALEQYTAALRLQPSAGEVGASAWMCRADLIVWSRFEEHTARLLASVNDTLNAAAAGRAAPGQAPTPVTPYEALFIDMPHALRLRLTSAWTARLTELAQRGLNTTATARAAAAGTAAHAHWHAVETAGAQATGSPAPVRRKLRLGYLSRRFEEYPGTHLMLGLFKRHTRSAVWLFCFASGPDDHSPERAAVARDCDEFVDVSTLSAAATAEVIAARQLDLLLDYDGAHDFNNIDALAHRPATVQSSYLGFAATTGSRSSNSGLLPPPFDHVLVDTTIAPPETAREMYSEKLLYAAGSYQPQNPKQPMDGPRLQLPGHSSRSSSTGAVATAWRAARARLRHEAALPVTVPHPPAHGASVTGAALQLSSDADADSRGAIIVPGGVWEDGTPEDDGVAEQEQEHLELEQEEPIVMVSFNRWHKLDPVMFTTWMNALRRAPSAVLWLYGGGKTPSVAGAVQSGKEGGEGEEDTPPHIAAVWQEAAAHGIHPSRIIFAGQVPRPAHLWRHYAADVQLDSRVYGAHTTAADGLFTGLPLLTLPGATFASRVGASLAQHAGPAADSTIVHSLSEYESVAAALGGGGSSSSSSSSSSMSLLAALRRRIESSIVAAIARSTSTDGVAAAPAAGAPVMFDAAGYTAAHERLLTAAVEAAVGAQGAGAASPQPGRFHVIHPPPTI